MFAWRRLIGLISILVVVLASALWPWRPAFAALSPDALAWIGLILIGPPLLALLLYLLWLYRPVGYQRQISTYELKPRPVLLSKMSKER